MQTVPCSEAVRKLCRGGEKDSAPCSWADGEAEQGLGGKAGGIAQSLPQDERRLEMAASDDELDDTNKLLC